MLNSDSNTILLNTLQSHWGYNTLRESQKGPVVSLAEGLNTIALLPTGAGKSLCFQLPSLYRCGICDNCTLNEVEILNSISIPNEGINAYELIRSFPPGHRHEVSAILRKLLDSKKIYAEGTMVYSASVT